MSRRRLKPTLQIKVRATKITILAAGFWLLFF
jgi:hypothetical protein